MTKESSSSQSVKISEDINAIFSLPRDDEDFLEVIDNFGITEDPAMQQFQLEYRKLYDALRKSHTQEQALGKMCRDLNSEILSNADRVKTALQQNQDDQATIAALRKEIDNAWTTADNSSKKEHNLNLQVMQLQDEVTLFQQEVKTVETRSLDKDIIIAEVTDDCKELKRLNKKQDNVIESLKKQLTDSGNLKNQLEDKINELNEKNEQMDSKVFSRESELKREQRRRERIESELCYVQKKFEEKVKEHEMCYQDAALAKSNVQKLDEELRTSRAKAKKEHDNLLESQQHIEKLVHDLDEQKRINKDVLLELNNTQDDLKHHHDESIKLSSEKARAQRKIDQEHNNALRYQRMIDESKIALSIAQNEVRSLRKEIDHMARQEKEKQREVDSLEREKNVHRNQLQRTEEKMKHTNSEVQQQEFMVRSLEKEISVEKEESLQLHAKIGHLEIENSKHISEIAEQKRLFEEAKDEVKIRDVQIKEFESIVSEWQSKFKVQKQEYSTVKHERNQKTKLVKDLQAQAKELKQETTMLNAQNEQLKQEISVKDSAYVKASYEQKNAITQAEQYKSEISRLSLTIRQNGDLVNKQDSEIRQLGALIKRMGDDVQRQHREYDNIRSERDVLGTQLLRRNDENALLYEKLKLQQSILRSGETQYRDRLEDIRFLKLKLKDVQRELNALKGGSVNVGDLSKELLQKHKELLQEKAKVKALSEELENPMNVHRWRKLEGHDPTTYEMIQKVQALQRRLIQKTELIIEKGVLVQEREKENIELKRCLKRQPSSEAIGNLNTYQANLKEKTRQLKAKEGELNMCQSQIHEYKNELERVTRDLQETKRKLHEQKRKEQEKQQAQISPLISFENRGENHMFGQARYTGGGFAIR
eukprot:CAMPEP_0116014336 /NCGR_PEP_ID=MMETSP0321-20121206/6219_1 /TAXON_ID=163516 /ORGANISM="Leptocylindrus danicus var. danicus, Strain B650" /LENGTH=878 /DNA_ID=CAMNT_0003483973 /DNA_START=30 /DNA_END=2666 /DNA_ORIENTATION=+